MVRVCDNTKAFSLCQFICKAQELSQTGAAATTQSSPARPISWRGMTKRRGPWNRGGGWARELVCYKIEFLHLKTHIFSLVLFWRPVLYLYMHTGPRPCLSCLQYLMYSYVFTFATSCMTWPSDQQHSRVFRGEQGAVHWDSRHESAEPGWHAWAPCRIIDRITALTEWQPITLPLWTQKLTGLIFLSVQTVPILPTSLHVALLYFYSFLETFLVYLSCHKLQSLFLSGTWMSSNWVWHKDGFLSFFVLNF